MSLCVWCGAPTSSTRRSRRSAALQRAVGCRCLSRGPASQHSRGPGARHRSPSRGLQWSQRRGTVRYLPEPAWTGLSR